MTLENIQDSVVGIVKNVIRKSVNPDQSLVHSGLLDSLGIVSLAADLEHTFGIEIEFDEVLPETFDTARSISALVTQKVQSSSPS